MHVVYITQEGVTPPPAGAPWNIMAKVDAHLFDWAPITIVKRKEV